MWFLNKETGLKWEVTDEELIQRLRTNGQYEEIKESKKAAGMTSAKSQGKELG